MSEVSDGAVTGPEGNGAGIDPCAVALALAGADREEANAFLRDQRALIADQRHHLREQFKQLRLNIWQQRMGVLLRVATAVVGLAVAGAACLLVLNAVNSHGLIIEPFAVPPDLTEKGFSGEVVAAKLQDKLTAIAAPTGSSRSPLSYSNDWGAHGIKLEIPETGVSLAELDDFLRAKLGSDIRVRGEIVHTDSGLSLTVRAGDQGADTVSGTDGEMDFLVQKLAESVYRLTQPYRYGVFLEASRRNAEAKSVFTRLVRTGATLDRAYGYNGLSDQASKDDSYYASISYLQHGLGVTPDFFRGRIGLADLEHYVGREEESLRDFRISLTLLADSRHGNARADFLPAYRKIAQAAVDAELGAYQDAVRERNDIVETVILGYGFGASQVIDTADEHDGPAARMALAAYSEKALQVLSGAIYGTTVISIPWASQNLAYQSQDWPGVLSQIPEFERSAADFGVSLRQRDLLERTQFGPLTATAQARLGNFAAAEALLAGMPGDCYRCMIAHARVAELRGQHERADWWFARAAAAAPSLPFAHQEWGQALLERGRPVDAIAKFEISNQKGPHFADPLEGWGEALMAKNQSHLALAKFAEAEKYAPNWGRLHLKWGQALFYAGKRDEASAQFARAMQLDLTPSEKAELARHS